MQSPEANGHETLSWVYHTACGAIQCPNLGRWTRLPQLTHQRKRRSLHDLLKEHFITLSILYLESDLDIFAIRLKIKLAVRVVTQARPSRKAVSRGCVSKWRTPFFPGVWSETTRTPETSAFSCGGTAVPVDSLSTSAAGAMPLLLGMWMGEGDSGKGLNDRAPRGGGIRWDTLSCREVPPRS